MRALLQALYRITLKGIGAFGLLLFVTFLIVALPGADPRDIAHPLPLAALGTLAVSSLVLAQFQGHLPECFVQPTRPPHAAAVFVAGAAIGLLTMLAVMIAVTSLGLRAGLDEITMRSISVNTTLVFGMFYAVAISLGALLSLWPVPQADRAEPA